MNQTVPPSALSDEKSGKIPPRERLLAVASDLFYRHGIKAVGVEWIAEAAGTNKMTLYRHFPSKDELVAEYLRRLASKENTLWQKLERDHPGDPRAQLNAWLRESADHVAGNDRGCPIANAAIELAEKSHPVRKVIEECKTCERERLVKLCRDAGMRDPELLADELILIFEGARVTAQCMGQAGPSAHLLNIGNLLIKAHS
jgi:AcrR family transcriptional regulator